MTRVRTISTCVSLGLLTPCGFAQQSTQPALSFNAVDEIIQIDGVEFPAILLDRRREQYNIYTLEPYSSLDPITLQELTQLRSAGIDPSWISDRLAIPHFNPSSQGSLLQRPTQGDHPRTIESWATNHSKGRGVQLTDSLKFSVGRTTELSDGNISGSDGTLSNGSGRDHVSSLSQSEGEYDLYDISLEWEAMSAGPVTLSILSGLKAIEANIAKRVTKGGITDIESAHRVTAMPMIGSGIRWQINEAFSFSGAAITHPIETGDALIDLNASTNLRISSNIGFSAGYRMIRSSFEVGSIETGVDQEGLFARLEISF